MYATIKKILGLLTLQERKRGLWVLAMLVIMALLETAGIASLMPFLAVLGDQAVIERNQYLAFVYARFNFVSVDAFLIALASAAFVTIVVSAVFRIWAQYIVNRFVNMRRHSIGQRLLETYLRQPYEYFVNHRSGDLAKNILSEVDVLVLNVFKPGFDAIAYGVVAVAIVGFLLFLDPMLATIVGTTLGLFYAFTYYAVKGLLGRIGEDRLVANHERFKAAGEAIGGIKEIKLLGCEYAYLSRFRPPSIRFARHQATNATMGQVPKYLVEAVGVGGVLALALVLLASDKGIGGVLPVLGVYVFAGYRLLPATQRIFSGISNIRFGASAVENAYSDLHDRGNLAEISLPAQQQLQLQKIIELTDLTFTYANSRNPTLHNLSLRIPVGSSIGLVGGTGAGKTTLVDLLLGLLVPSEGGLFVDGVRITRDNIRSWQRTLGYVPQNIFLLDASIAENIAMGEPVDQIDYEAVERCGRIAQLDDFVMNDLPQRYATNVGERGVRLSGGQKQRIGIARALYRNPSVLVFDEATSALDNVTERAVMDAVSLLRGQKTIIMIAHRLSTVASCDKVVLLNKGEIKAQGTFAELAASDESFRNLASAVKEAT